MMMCQWMAGGSAFLVAVGALLIFLFDFYELKTSKTLLILGQECEKDAGWPRLSRNIRFFHSMRFARSAREELRK